jgi:hypothetical protein
LVVRDKNRFLKTYSGKISSISGQDPSLYFFFARYYHYWLVYPDIWTRLFLHELHHLWLPQLAIY